MHLFVLIAAVLAAQSATAAPYPLSLTPAHSLAPSLANERASDRTLIDSVADDLAPTPHIRDTRFPSRQAGMGPHVGPTVYIKSYATSSAKRVWAEQVPSDGHSRKLYQTLLNGIVTGVSAAMKRAEWIRWEYTLPALDGGTVSLSNSTALDRRQQARVGLAIALGYSGPPMYKSAKTLSEMKNGTAWIVNCALSESAMVCGELVMCEDAGCEAVHIVVAPHGGWEEEAARKCRGVEIKWWASDWTQVEL